MNFKNWKVGYFQQKDRLYFLNYPLQIAEVLIKYESKVSEVRRPGRPVKFIKLKLIPKLNYHENDEKLFKNFRH